MVANSAIQVLPSCATSGVLPPTKAVSSFSCAPLHGNVWTSTRTPGWLASKAGMIALTKSVARDTATDGIMVTAVTPSAAETAMAKEISAERRAEIMARIPMGRFVEVDEVARMVLWLSSDDCSFSTGGIFDLSGGRASY